MYADPFRIDDPSADTITASHSEAVFYLPPSMICNFGDHPLMPPPLPHAISHQWIQRLALSALFDRFAAVVYQGHGYLDGRV